MKIHKILVLLAATMIFAASTLVAQPGYGSPIQLAEAEKVMAAAEAHAVENNWNVAIAIVDTGGQLVLFKRMDDTQFGSLDVARQKAYASAAFRRSTKVFEDALAGGGTGLRLLSVEGIIAAEGGLPIVKEGKVIGAIGVSGVTSAQDGLIAQAGLDAIK